MNTLEMFRAIRRGGYTHNWLGVDWKIENRYMIFEESDGKSDWTFNLLSVFRIPGRLGGTWFLFPLGAWIMWKSIKGTVKKLAKEKKIDAFLGYSQGGWWAGYSSAETLLPAYTFGCPKLGIGSPSLFVDVTHYKNPADIVTKLPPWAKQYGQTMILNKQIERPSGTSEIEWISHHSPDEYEARLS